MHYTSLENIHKVIDPLFLDDLKAELADIKATSVAKTKRERAFAFQDKLAGLKFFDPACGSGNFLTESYTSLRRLENEALRIIYGDNRVIGEMAEPIKVSINQFYGIEINDFACSVAQTALWIAESQMMQETDEIVGFNLDPLPLKTYTNIHEGNALRIDWNEVVPASELNYIMGNPPFVGYSLQSESQKQDILDLLVDEKGKQLKTAGKVDYVAGWYYKAAAYMQDGNIQAALVSTNSIVQGEQVAGIWGPLISQYGIVINFAYKTFRWDSEANAKAHVHCVIIGFSNHSTSKKKQIFEGDSVLQANHINPYLVDASDVIIGSRSKPICEVPEMRSGGKPVEGGFLIFTDEEKTDFLKQEPGAEPYFRPFMGSDDYINAHPRWCLWLLNVSPKELRQMPKVMERVESVREFRLASVKAATREMADQPARFMEIKQPSSDYIMMPATSSENRKYIPMGFLSKDVIASNAASFVPDATLYHLGVLTSSVHMAWMRVVCGRLEMRYRYSVNIVYNNFPWPQPVDSQKEKISQTAQAILDARALYPESSLADLYDELAMPIELRKAHRANDAAVLEAYGFPKDATEAEIVARLFKMYQDLTK